MKPPLRSLSGLVDFECAARWNSFKLAAAELHKTPAAVSQQIKHLEEELGFELFVRQPRNIALTEKGRELSVTVARTLAELRSKVNALRSGDEETVLRISATHSLSFKWLVPRMAKFTRLYPEIDIRLDSSDSNANLDDGSTDIAIRYGVAHVGDPDLLFREKLVAVYSPELLAQRAAGLPGAGAQELKIADLQNHPLLYGSSPEKWLMFLQENRAIHSRYHFARGFTSWGVLAQAAVAAQGVALVGYSIVHDDLQNGTLNMVAGRSPEYDWGYRFLTCASSAGLPKVTRFRAWLEGEMREMQRAVASL
ncbi:LysR family transcriptional regulator [Oxalobacteraceae bacterium]|nr:LysR family transcriptional regulator [Oxalobacteraceae bacterium]